MRHGYFILLCAIAAAAILLADQISERVLATDITKNIEIIKSNNSK